MMIRRLLSKRLPFIRPQFCINHIFDTQDQFKKLNKSSIDSIKSSVKPLSSPTEEAGLLWKKIKCAIRKSPEILLQNRCQINQWEGDLIKELGLDSLERIALITSIEHEFTAIFEDRVFDNLNTLKDIKKQILKDDSAF